jgi:hypothetical protein
MQSAACPQGTHALAKAFTDNPSQVHRTSLTDPSDKPYTNLITKAGMRAHIQANLNTLTPPTLWQHTYISTARTPPRQSLLQPIRPVQAPSAPSSCRNLQKEGSRCQHRSQQGPRDHFQASPCSCLLLAYECLHFPQPLGRPTHMCAACAVRSLYAVSPMHLCTACTVLYRSLCNSAHHGE